MNNKQTAGQGRTDMESYLLGLSDEYFSSLEQIINQEIRTFGVVGPFLDIGCGLGFWVKTCLENGIPAVGADVSPELLIQRRSRFGVKTAVLASGDALPFASSVFGWVQLSEVIEHLPADRARTVLNEVYRVLKPDGVVRVTTPNRLKYLAPSLRPLGSLSGLLGRPSDKAHLREWFPWEIRSMLTQYGFDVRSLELIGPTRWAIIPVLRPGIQVFARKTRA